MTPEQAKIWQPNPKLTNKQNNFVRQRLNDVKASGTAIVQQVYGQENKPVSKDTAGRIAHDLMHNETVLAELYKYSGQAELNLIKLANATTDYAMEGGRDGAAYASVAEKLNNSLLDRLHGKATTKIEQTSQSVTINIDLTKTIQADNDVTGA